MVAYLPLRTGDVKSEVVPRDHAKVQEQAGLRGPPQTGPSWLLRPGQALIALPEPPHQTIQIAGTRDF